MGMRIIALGVLLGLSMGCYTVQLQPISEIPGQSFGETATIDVLEPSANYVYEVRSFAAGFGNRWRIDVGDGLVQYAEAYLRPVFPEGDDLRVQITIEGFDVRDFEAHVDARFAISRESEIVFNRKYHAQGVGHFAQTAWGGAFAMKSSMRKTTDEALRSLFEQFLTDMQREGAFPLRREETSTD
jgi:hypothetical protein